MTMVEFHCRQIIASMNHNRPCNTFHWLELPVFVTLPLGSLRVARWQILMSFPPRVYAVILGAKEEHLHLIAILLFYLCQL